MSQIEEACKLLNKSMKGLGTNEELLIEGIIKHKNATRQLIKSQYLKMYGKTLEEHIKSEISGHFLESVLALLEPTDEYEAKIVRKAINNLGTNEKILIQIICPKDSNEIETLKKTYKRLFNSDLENDIAEDTSNHFKKIMRSITSLSRDNSRYITDSALAKSEAKELYDAGEGKLGTDDSTFIRILSTRSFNQLKATFEEYKKIAYNDIDTAIKQEMSGSLEFACLTIVKSARNKSAYFAEQLYESMKGFGTRDSELIMILVSRAEIDLKEIKQCYKSMYNKSLYDAVKSELSGDYEKLFLALIGKD